jgi:hypothetical protein
LIDAVPSFRDSTLLRDQPDVLDYFISLRRGFLPLRIGDYAFIEPYSPHRCAHQFGLDQGVPTFFFRPESLGVDLEGLGWCLLLLLSLRYFLCSAGKYFIDFTLRTINLICKST